MSERLQEGSCSVFVALVGRPNVGKSSLTNRLVGEKVAIVTPKPQTTRTRITGIVTKGPVQYVLLDTPGLHTPRTKLGERMKKTAAASVADVDAALMLFEPYGELTGEELAMAQGLRKQGCPAIAVVNKTDTLKNAGDLAVRFDRLRQLNAFCQFAGISVVADEGCGELLELLRPFAVPGPHFFADDAYTDMPEKALVSEILREKMLLYLRDEVPHGIAVTIERFSERPGRELIDIDANIYCERKSHKGMVIGKGGQMLKKIASAARADCEEFLGARVNLQCWVKIKNDWRDSDFLLNDFGFKQP